MSIAIGTIYQGSEINGAARATSAAVATTGRLVIGWANWEDANVDVQSVVDTAGNVWALAPAKVVDGSGATSSRMFYCLSSKAHASNQITVTLTGSAFFFSVYAFEVYESTGPVAWIFDNLSSNTGTGAPASYTSPSVNVPALPAIVASMVSTYSAQTFTHTGQTLVIKHRGGGEIVYQVPGSTGSVSPNIQWSGASAWNATTAVFRQVAGRVQSVTGVSDPGGVTLAAATAGNLLIAMANERSGGDHANHTAPVGFTKRIGLNVQQADLDFRKSLSVWTKTAAGGETLLNFDDGTANAKRVTVQEFFGVTESQLAAVAAAGDSSATNDTAQDSGPTDVSVSGDLFLWAGFYDKVDSPEIAITDMAWTNGPDAAHNVITNGAAFGQSHVTTFGVVAGAATGTRSTLATPTGGTNNRGMITTLLAFQISAVAPAALSGTIIGSSEADIRASAKTLTVTLGVDTLLPS